MYFKFHRALLPLVAGCLLSSGQMLSLQAKEPTKVNPEFSEAQIVHHDIFYKTEPARTKLESEKCRLDIYLPAKSTDYPVIVWFHGGGLREGDKKGDADFAASLTSKGIALVSVNYRLSPDVKFPAYIRDAATAVAWSKKNLGRYGANVNRFFVGGHSAGAYISLLLGQDEKYLKAEGMALSDITGLLPVSSQIMTHFTIREERGLSKERVIADEASPMYHARKDAPPMLLLLGDKDWPARYEENVYFKKYSEVLGNNHVYLLQVKNRDHGGIFNKMVENSDDGRKALLAFVASNGKSIK